MTDVVYHLVVRAFVFVFGPLVWRLDVRATGTDNLPRGGAVLAITHFGYVDFAITGQVVWHHDRRFIRFLATAASFRHPLSGPLMRAMKHVPVDRAAGAGAYVEAVRRLRSGALVGVFPESSVNRAYVVRECKTGAVRMAAEAGVPLVPIAVWGGQRVMTRGRKIRFRERCGVAVRVVVGEPILLLRDGDVRAETDALRDRMNELVGVAQRSYPHPATPGDDWWQPAALGGSAPTPEQAAAMDAADDAARRSRPEHPDRTPTKEIA